MGRILEYVVLLSNLSLILTVQQYKEPSHANNYEREKQENLTHTIKQYFPKDQNELFNKKTLPLDFHGRRRPFPPGPKQMRMSIGLHAFASNDQEWKGRKRNSSEPNTAYSNSPRRNFSPSSLQALNQRKNSKNYWSVDYHGEIPSQRLSKQYNLNNSLNVQNQRPDDFYRRYHKEGRNAKHHSQRATKICDPCSSVPWIPLLKVPESYRQQRTHVTELHPTPHQNFNFDYHAFASNTHNVLLPPVPRVAPPFEAGYDGTISSSFGLPVGNIPTSHGLLAPINRVTTRVNKYGTDAFDYSNSFNYFAPQGLLENHAFPEFPIVPIHDSRQFYPFDSTVPDLVPPPTKSFDVSKVVLTISEENSPKLEPPKPEIFPNHKPENALSLESATLDSQASHSQTKEKNQNTDFGRLEIVKSIPLAEFTSSVHFPHQDLPLYPPLQSEFSNDFVDSKKYNPQGLFNDQSISDFNFLVPPPKPEPNLSSGSNESVDSTFSKSSINSELQGESSAPKPLTSPSLSWLFSDHTAPPGDSVSTVSVSSFVTEAQEIASIVNNELRPVSSHPLPFTSHSEQNVATAKSKKIQIIIPYTTKNKDGHDNNVIESVQHEVFQPPVSKPAIENESFGDFATSAHPPLTHSPETSGKRKVIDGIEKQFKNENHQVGEHKNRKYLSEMHHIIASNIRDLLKKEIEKSQSDQNYPLQNNIDNWTALEYSNHKTVEMKAPKEIINQALAVTSIPGTSISHLLLPSKKIPNEYFVTTPLPVYDEPNSSVYQAVNTTVNSSPFTAKPYATTSIYNPTRSFKENDKRTTESEPLINQANHDKNYTKLGRGNVNNWGRQNENLVLPEARSKTRRIEQTKSSGWTSNLSASSGTEKVQIVTPISLTTPRNYTMTPFRRTTRHIHRTYTSMTESPKTKRLFFSRHNSTKLEKVSNQTLLFNRKYTYNLTTAPTVNSSQTELREQKANSTVLVESSAPKTDSTSFSKNQTSEEVKINSKSEHLSINDIFPFRNKELPWESNVNDSARVFQFERQRKSLIKQVNLPKLKKVEGSS